MKVDVLLKTRGLKWDYRWVYCPDYVDSVLDEKMAFLTQMMHKSSLKKYFVEEGLQNIYFIHDENGCVLIRGGLSRNVDILGRTIYAVEGLACPAEKSRSFWYALPYLIDRLEREPLLRDRWLSDQTEVSHVQNRQLNFSSLTEDSLFMEPEEEGSIWQQIQDHSPEMERLMHDIYASREMYSFVYGTKSRGFYPVTMRNYYSSGEADGGPVPVRREVQTSLNPVVDEREILYRIEIQIEKQGKRFAAFLVAVDMDGEAIAETDPMTFGKEGIDMAQMERARIALGRKLESMGYHRGRRQEE